MLDLNKLNSFCNDNIYTTMNKQPSLLRTAKPSFALWSFGVCLFAQQSWRHSSHPRDKKSRFLTS